MTYNPLTDDILLACEAAFDRARSSRREDGTFPLTHLLSGFDLHPAVMSELVQDQVENHRGRFESGADLTTVLTSLFVDGLLIGLFVGEVREARRLAARGVA